MYAKGILDSTIFSEPNYMFLKGEKLCLGHATSEMA
jgi:hypothetical protein